MNKFYIKQWNENKDKLRQYFSELDDSDLTYETIVRKIFELVVTQFDDYYSFDANKLTVIDHGHWQGSTIYIIPADSYQPDPEDYVITHNYYGSCSGCDTLLSILGYGDGKLSDQQISDLMTLSLHLVQKIKPLIEEEQ